MSCESNTHKPHTGKASFKRWHRMIEARAAQAVIANFDPIKGFGDDVSEKKENRHD